MMANQSAKRWIWMFAMLARSAWGADLREAEVIRWIEANGGDTKTNEAARTNDVYLGFGWVTDNDLKRLRALPQLSRLDLSHTYVSEAGIAFLRSFENLVDLNLFAAESINDAAMRHVRGWTALRRLNLRSTDVSDTSMPYLATLSGLRSLDISCTWLTDDGLEYLPELTELEELYLGGNKITGGALQVLRLLPKLRSLNLKGSQRRNTGYWAVSITDLDMDVIGSLTRLEELDLGQSSRVDSRIAGMKISDHGVAKLKELTRLRSLDLSGTRVTGAGLESLVPLEKLERLSLWSARGIDDTAAPRLAAMKSLAVLDLAQTAVTDRTLERLAGLGGLRHLFVSGTKVTGPGVEAFRRARPDCEISWK
ncbi:MAG: hypothetical protein EXQ52_10725 [Bryobacterales bacterium]|nr:hypothetical protein [Bryobacterales bacterium]